MEGAHVGGTAVSCIRLRSSMKTHRCAGGVFGPSMGRGFVYKYSSVAPPSYQRSKQQACTTSLFLNI